MTLPENQLQDSPQPTLDTLADIDSEFEGMSEEEASERLKVKLKSQRWRLDHLYYIIDEKGNRIQFKMRKAQLLIYLGLWFLNLILKSRQHGITTLSCILFLDICLFNSNTSACIIAHKKEDASDFFDNKIRYAYNNLPDWLQAAVPAKRDSIRAYKFGNGSSIKVTTSGRSGTYQLVHISELGPMAATPKKSDEVKTGTLNTIHPGQILIIESTANGKEGLFYEYAELAKKVHDSGQKLSKLDFKYFFLPWYWNPLNELDPDGVIVYQYQKEQIKKIEAEAGIQLTDRQIAWYVKKWQQQGDDIFQEHPSTFDEAFSAFLRGAYYKREFVTLRKKGRITKVEFSPNTLVDTWWDLGFNNINAIWFTQNVGREVHVIDYFEDDGEGLPYYARILEEKREELGYRYGRHVAPHDIAQHQYGDGKTRLQIARENGINFEVGVAYFKDDQIEASRAMLNTCWFDEERCQVGLNHLEAYRREFNERTGAYKNTPFHGPESNAADAFHVLSTNHTFRGDILSPSTIKSLQKRERAKKNPRAWS